jgi:hypothetical protein
MFYQKVFYVWLSAAGPASKVLSRFEWMRRLARTAPVRARMFFGLAVGSADGTKVGP